MCTKRRTPASFAAASRSRDPSTMIRWNCSRRPCRIGEVALRQLATPGRQLGSCTQITDEAAHRQVAAAQLVDDVAPYETGASRYEDQPVVSFWKFCQYFDGVGPRCPWYF